MPTNNSIRLDDDQALFPSGKPIAGQDPESPIGVANLRSKLAAPKYDQLLPKAEIFGSQSCFGLEDGSESIGKAPNHQKGLYVVLINGMFGIGQVPILSPDGNFAPYKCTRERHTPRTYTTNNVRAGNQLYV